MASSPGDGGDEIDPLDAFMQSVSAELAMADGQLASDGSLKGSRELLEADDPLADYVTVDTTVAGSNDAEEPQMDDDDVIQLTDTNISALPLVDHSSRKYSAFRRDILKVHPEIAAMTRDQIKKARSTLGIQLHGLGTIAAPGLSFGHLGISERMLEAASASGFETPTPIQSQAVPVALSGRDVIGVASTGSGKTAAFLWPLILHLQAQSYTPMTKGQGPAALILAPTRELSTQIYLEAKKLFKAANKRTPAHKKLRVAGVFGGMQMYQQSLELAAGVDLVVATPGRLLDHLRKEQAHLDQVTFVVVDEADRLLQMGFEAQARAILSQIRPDRQTLLFSATFKRRVEALARSVLKNPVRIVVGTIGASSQTVNQIVEVFPSLNDRIKWLRSHLNQFLARGQLIIFAGTRVSCDLLGKSLLPSKSVVIHGDKTQSERMDAIQQIKKGTVQIVVATDVAARGLDISNLATVINFELARDVDSHVHRIGRVGRKGQDEAGMAITLLSHDMERKVARALPLILQNIEQAGQKASQEAWTLAHRLAPDEFTKLKPSSSASGGRSSSSSASLVHSNPNVSAGIGSFVDYNAKSSSKRFESNIIPGSAVKLRQQFQNSFKKSSHTLGCDIEATTVATPATKPSRWDAPSPIPVQSPSQPPSHGSSLNEPPKKRSRWDS